MQFLPTTWKTYGVDANGDGVADPGNPVDAIFAAARYLRAAGAHQDLRRAVFAYNRADWYVDWVLLRAAQIAVLPDRVVGSFTDLAKGRFPVAAHSTYAGGAGGARITARRGAPVVAVRAGRIVRVGRTEQLGRFVRLKARSGVSYTYAHLGRIGRAGRRSKARLYARRANGIRLSRLRPGTWVPAGAVVGRMSWTGRGGPAHMVFQIRTAGRGGRRVDPVPFLAGWELLEGARAEHLAGMSDRALAARVLVDPRVEIYACGREDIQAGRIDRRVLATLELLADSGLRPTVSALECGHSLMTTSGNISEHSTGDAVDISAINGTPIAGHQGPGSITEVVIRRLLTLQGAMQPHQIISLMQFQGAPNTLAMPDHADHIHVGWRPEPTAIAASSTR